jgi:oligopeptide transport system substrate-binding protein
VIILEQLYYIRSIDWRIIVNSLLILSGLLLLGACGQNEPATIVVTEVVVVDGGETVVTRLVRQTVAVTVTPNSLAQPVTYQPTELDVAMIGSFPDIDPQKATDANGIDLIENLFVGLSRFDHESNRIEPELATEWEVSRDGRVWTFHLREDVYWVRPIGNAPDEDGLWQAEPVRQVVAADVAYAVQRACLRETGTPDAFILYLIEGCEQVHDVIEVLPAELDGIGARALDDFTLQFSLTKPASQFLTITSMSLMKPVPRELVDEMGDDWQLGENLMVSGPFLLAPKPEPAMRPALHRNPLWPIPRRGNVDIANIVLLNEAMPAFQLWQAKRVDASPLPASERQAFLDQSSLKAILVTDQTVFYLGFNFSSGVMRVPEVRRALNAAIDRDRLAEEIYGGRAVSMRHLAPPGVVAAPPVDEVGKGYDPDYARQQMAESGFRACRLMPSFTYLVSTSDLSLQQAELIREMWVEELDCSEEQIIIRQVQFGTLLANTRQEAGADRPDIWELGWASYYPDAHNWVGDLLHCTESENRQGRPCAEVDEIIRQASNEFEPERRLALYRQIEDQFFGSNGIEPLAPLYAPGEYVLVQSWLTYAPALFGGEQYDSYVLEAELKQLEQSR